MLGVGGVCVWSKVMCGWFVCLFILLRGEVGVDRVCGVFLGGGGKGEMVV